MEQLFFERSTKNKMQFNILIILLFSLARANEFRNQLEVMKDDQRWADFIILKNIEKTRS